MYRKKRRAVLTVVQSSGEGRHLDSQTIEFLYSFKLIHIVVSGTLKAHLHLELSFACILCSGVCNCLPFKITVPEFRHTSTHLQGLG